MISSRPEYCGLKLMPFGNFANVRILLYCSPEIGTYAGDVATFPDSKPNLVPERIANRLSRRVGPPGGTEGRANDAAPSRAQTARTPQSAVADADLSRDARSEEHTSELQSRLHLVCRLLLEKKKK